MVGNWTIRKLLTASLAVVVLLWAEAGLALVPGDRVVMQCRAMMLQGHAQSMATADNEPANPDDSDAMPCCPADPAHAPKLAASHPPCCSSNDVPERPLGFLVNSDRAMAHPVDVIAEVAVSFAPPAQRHCELHSADAPRFVKPVLDLKSDLRI